MWKYLCKDKNLFSSWQKIFICPQGGKGRKLTGIQRKDHIIYQISEKMLCSRCSVRIFPWEFLYTLPNQKDSFTYPLFRSPCHHSSIFLVNLLVIARNWEYFALVSFNLAWTINILSLLKGELFSSLLFYSFLPRKAVALDRSTWYGHLSSRLCSCTSQTFSD